MSNLFTEIRFDPGVIPKGTGGYTFSTSIVRTHFDAERRNCARPDWLFKGDFGEVILNRQQVAYVVAFFNARKGKAEGFRFKYWGDFEATAKIKTVGGSATTQGVAIAVQGDTTGKLFQLYKRYSDSGDNTDKLISKPVQSNAADHQVKIYVGGTLVTSGFAIDYTTGIIQFDSASGGAVTWDGEFDLPCWFDVDALPGVQIYHSDGREVLGATGPVSPILALPGSEIDDVFRFTSLPVVELYTTKYMPNLYTPSAVGVQQGAIAPTSPTTAGMYIILVGDKDVFFKHNGGSTSGYYDSTGVPSDTYKVKTFRLAGTNPNDGLPYYYADLYKNNILLYTDPYPWYNVRIYSVTQGFSS